MPGTEEIIIRNGTFRQWLNYYVVVGGQQSGEYGSTGGLRVKGYWFAGALVVVGAVLGALVG